MSEDSAKASRAGCVARIVCYTLLGFVGLFLLMVLGLPEWPVELLFHGIAGPVLHGWKTLPPFLAKWPDLILPLVCLALACLGGHRFIRWWVATTGDRVVWRSTHTLILSALLLLGSAAAIALSGVVHQAAWLGSTPWIESNHNSKHLEAHIYTREILHALLEYESVNGRFPESLSMASAQLEEWGVDRNRLWMQPVLGAPMEPFVLLRPGAEDIGVSLPLVVSPMVQRGRVFVVGYTSGEVRRLIAEEWEKELLRLHEYD